MYTRNYSLFDGSSAQSSDFTSDDYLVADYEQLTISIRTDDGGASRYTIEASNDEGFDSAISERSLLTTIVLQGLYTIDPGARYIRCTRSSLDSMSEVKLQLRC